LEIWGRHRDLEVEYFRDGVIDLNYV
jgi:hypothetical protein